MEYEAIVQTVLEEIDRRITETICAEDLARTAGYSLYHFCRIFMNLTGMPVKGYILRRKLEFALYDLMSCDTGRFICRTDNALGGGSRVYPNDTRSVERPS